MACAEGWQVLAREVKAAVAVASLVMAQVASVHGLGHAVCAAGTARAAMSA